MAVGERVARELPFKSLEGISEKQISEHYEVLYKGYVKKLNEIEAKLETADRALANATYSEVGELKREQAFCTNAIYLHEAYFASLGGNGGKPEGELLKAIEEDFGSYEKWAEDFAASGVAARGWVVLAFNWVEGRLRNYSSDYHTQGAWGCSPLLVLDVYEHAYFLDFATARKKYIEAYFKNLNWGFAQSLFEKYGVGRARDSMKK